MHPKRVCMLYKLGCLALYVPWMWLPLNVRRGKNQGELRKVRFGNGSTWRQWLNCLISIINSSSTWAHSGLPSAVTNCHWILSRALLYLQYQLLFVWDDVLFTSTVLETDAHSERLQRCLQVWLKHWHRHYTLHRVCFIPFLCSRSLSVTSLPFSLKPTEIPNARTFAHFP